MAFVEQPRWQSVSVYGMTEFITTAVQIRRVEISTLNIAQSMGYNLILPKIAAIN